MEMRLEKKNCNSFRKTRNFYFGNTQNTKICLNFNFPGGGGYSGYSGGVFWVFQGGYSGYSVTENTQSPKRGGILGIPGGGYSGYSGGGYSGYSVTENTQSPKICLNFNFRGGGVFCN